MGTVFRRFGLRILIYAVTSIFISVGSASELEIVTCDMALKKLDRAQSGMNTAAACGFNDVTVDFGDNPPVSLIDPAALRPIRNEKPAEKKPIAKPVEKQIPKVAKKPNTKKINKSPQRVADKTLRGEKCIPTVDSVSGFDFSVLPHRNRAHEFLHLVAPVAVEIQEKTGLPASVIMAQAAIESAGGSQGFGMGKGYRNRNAMFGHSCCFGSGKCKDSEVNRTFTLTTRQGEVISVKGTCNAYRPKNEGGRYYTFADAKDSAWAHAWLLLQNPKTAGVYGGVREAVKRAGPKGVGNSTAVVDGLKRYAAAGNYMDSLKKIINTYNLKKYDNRRSCLLPERLLNSGRGLAHSGGQ